MSEADKAETEVKGSVNVNMDNPVKSLSCSTGKDSDGNVEQVVNSATTTTTATLEEQEPCQKTHQDLTHCDGVTANSVEDMPDKNACGLQNSPDCGVIQQHGQNSSDKSSIDSETSETSDKTNSSAEVAKPITGDSTVKVDVSNDDATRTTQSGDQDQGSLSEEQTPQSTGDVSHSTVTEESRSGSSINDNKSPKPADNFGNLTQVVSKTAEGDEAKTTSAEENSLPEPASSPNKVANQCSSTAEPVTHDTSGSTNENAPSSTLETGEQLMVNLPPVENVRDGESACASAADEDCGATAAAAPSVLCASATPSCSQQSSEDRGQSIGAVSPDDPNSAPSVYSVKWVMFKNNKVPVITQNENGPCPLIAIMNVLLLQKKIQFPALMEMVTSDQLMSYLGECIFENAPKNITEDSRLNYEQNMQDAMAVFHKLQTGLDVNVRFTGVCDFEYTPECIIFDLLEIRLYHGWLVDPQEPQVGAAVGNCSYNQLVEKIIAQKSSEKQEQVTEALIAETFLESSASQLTYHGLCELSTTVKEGELCVCFRNNHFSTFYKHKGELFILVTDQGFLTESNVVWETLSNVEGDCHFVDANFHTYTKPELAPLVASDIPAGSEQQIDQDYLVALSLQQEQQLTVDQEASWNSQPQPQPQTGAPVVPLTQLSDHELAMRLQEEEDRRAAAAYQQQQQQPPAQQPHQQPRSPSSQSSSSSGGRRPRDRDRERKEKEKDKESCAIL